MGDHYPDWRARAAGVRLARPSPQSSPLEGEADEVAGEGCLP